MLNRTAQASTDKEVGYFPGRSPGRILGTAEPPADPSGSEEKTMRTKRLKRNSAVYWWLLSAFVFFAVPAEAQEQGLRLGPGIEATGVLQAIDLEGGLLVIDGRRFAVDANTLAVYQGERLVGLGRLEDGWNVRFYYMPSANRPVLLEVHLLNSALSLDERG